MLVKLNQYNKSNTELKQSKFRLKINTTYRLIRVLRDHIKLWSNSYKKKEVPLVLCKPISNIRSCQQREKGLLIINCLMKGIGECFKTDDVSRLDRANGTHSKFGKPLNRPS